LEIEKLSFNFALIMKTKRYFIFSLICMLAVCSQAQDRIVNIVNNTLFCKVPDANSETVRYPIQKEGIQTTNATGWECMGACQINEDESRQEPIDAGTKEKKSDEPMSATSWVISGILSFRTK
jgi:hypothetical protein